MPQWGVSLLRSQSAIWVGHNPFSGSSVYSVLTTWFPFLATTLFYSPTRHISRKVCLLGKNDKGLKLYVDLKLVLDAAWWSVAVSWPPKQRFACNVSFWVAIYLLGRCPCGPRKAMLKTNEPYRQGSSESQTSAQPAKSTVTTDRVWIQMHISKCPLN